VLDYSGGLYRRGTIEALADAFLAALREVIDHCTAVATERSAASAS